MELDDYVNKYSVSTVHYSVPCSYSIMFLHAVRNHYDFSKLTEVVTAVKTLLTFGVHVRSRGYSSLLVCVSVCLLVCPLTL